MNNNELCPEKSKIAESVFFSGVYNIVKEKEYTPFR